ncbi:MAG TPA: ATP-binding protein [Microbacteriaceae bacterium]|nr:ATP-binding protein [Microbacteriaceae bacterium]
MGSRPHDPERSAAGWIFPMRAAVTTTRIGLLAAGVAIGLSAAAVFALIGILLAVISPGSIAVWAPAALLPVALLYCVAWRWEPISPARALLLVLLAASSHALLTLAVSQSPIAAPAGTSTFVLTMMVVSTVLVATAADRWSGGLLGAAVGYLVAEGAVLLTGVAVGLSIRFDATALTVAAATAALSALFPLARARARGRSESLEAADRHAREARIRESERRELLAQLHDTVLGDLTLIALRRPGAFDDAERGELESTLAVSSMLPVLRTDDVAISPSLAAVAAAGGLELVIEGELAELDRLPDPARTAVASALEQCVVNVVRHAGVGAVRLGVHATTRDITVQVVDEGIGFDPSTVAADRFGLSESVRGRIEREGGTVEVRSAPGSGTHILIRLPREAGS